MQRGWLAEPATLFLLALTLISLISAWSAAADLSVSINGETRAVRSLLAPEGLWWWLSHVARNFTGFPPLGLVIVGLLGVGLAEHSGLLAASLKLGLRGIPAAMLGPAVLFVGINSSVAVDAGYVVVPPLAAALFAAAGRSPIAGLAAAYAGVAGGYSANLLLTAGDPLLAGLTQAAAAIKATDYQVAATCNWWFLAASTPLLVLAGWIALAWLERYLPHPASVMANTAESGLGRRELRALRHAGVTLAGLLALTAWSCLDPAGTLHGTGEHYARLIEASVPLLALYFGLPACVYGYSTGGLPDLSAGYRVLERTLSDLAPYLLISFFAAQFIACFSYTGLAEWLAVNLGDWLRDQALPRALLLLVTMMLVMTLDLCIASASAKYALIAPVLVPAFMAVGLSPELAQATYRVGDSITNTISPLNPYMVLVLGYLRRYAPEAGYGMLARLMLPFMVTFGICWPLFLLAWVELGIPLGPAGPLAFLR